MLVLYNDFKIFLRFFMTDTPKCIKCNSEYTYENGAFFVCSECGYEWSSQSLNEVAVEDSCVKDAYGNILKDGDSVTIIKDIKVKGSATALKVGVKVKNIRIVDEVNGHNIEAKVPGFGTMMLKSEIVKKSN